VKAFNNEFLSMNFVIEVELYFTYFLQI